MIKFCKNCLSDKSVDDYYIAKIGKKNQPIYQAVCKSCHNQRSLDRIKSLSEEDRKSLSKKNNDRLRVSGYAKNYRLKRNYSISTGQYEEMLKEQLGGCAICETTISYGSKSLAVDHCHQTGKVRGLLCTACNTALGLLKEDMELFKKSIQYLELHNDTLRKDTLA